MAERPIIFCGPMVRAILDGRKTMTRRMLKLPKAPMLLGEWEVSSMGGPGVFNARGEPEPEFPCLWHTRSGACVGPGYRVGQQLWVRETWGMGLSDHGDCPRYRSTMDYKCGDKIKSPHEGPFKWRPSIFMPRWASRITLEVTGVKVERLQDISEDDARAEGVRGNSGGAWGCEGLVEDFTDLWNGIHGESSWHENPWVVAVTFRRMEDGELL